MTCEQLAQLYEEYALGVLDGEERAEIEQHLARACPTCTPGVAAARGFISQLALAAPDVPPPAELRAKIMDSVKASGEALRGTTQVMQTNRTERKTTFPAWAWLVAAMLALVTGYSIRQMSRQTDQLAEMRKEIKIATMQTQALQNQLEMDRMVSSVMLSSDSRQIKLEPADKNMPIVHAYLHPHMGVAITADQMPSMPSARTLQLWFVPKSGKPVSAAIFHPDTSGQIAFVAPVTIPMNEIAALAVTEEPAGGSPQPTTAIAWIAKVNN
jgi:anti-sigma-K factor RskA